MKALRLLALAAVIVAPCAARAADLPVSYTADEKALKAAVAGTNVTFDLYTDSACAGPIAHTETLAIENVDLISRLKLGVAKGALVKPPKTDELRTTLTGVTTSGNLYLKVTGTGITAVGGSCQPQAPQAAPLSPSLPSINGLRLFFELNATGRWGVVNAQALSLPNPTDVLPVDRSAAATMQSFNTATEELCNVQTNIQAGNALWFLNQSRGQLIVFSFDGCVDPCANGLKDGLETDVDCGGAPNSTHCPGCAAGKICVYGGDCQSNVCSGSVCQP